MTGLLYVADGAEVTATPDTMTLVFQSGTETINLILTRHAAMMTRSRMAREEYAFRCAPDGELVTLPKPKRRNA